MCIKPADRRRRLPHGQDGAALAGQGFVSLAKDALPRLATQGLQGRVSANICRLKDIERGAVKLVKVDAEGASVGPRYRENFPLLNCSGLDGSRDNNGTLRT